MSGSRQCAAGRADIVDRMTSTVDSRHTAIEPGILYFGTPVVLISTENEDGSANLAPMSSAFWLGWRAVLGLNARSKTTENLVRTRECVLNLASDALAANVDRLALTTGSDRPRCLAPSDHELSAALRPWASGASVDARASARAAVSRAGHRTGSKVVSADATRSNCPFRDRVRSASRGLTPDQACCPHRTAA